MISHTKVIRINIDSVWSGQCFKIYNWVSTYHKERFLSEDFASSHCRWSLKCLPLPDFFSRPHWYALICVCCSEGEEWQSVRSLLGKHMLRPKAVEAYDGTLNAVVTDLIHKLKLRSQQCSSGLVTDISAEFYRFGLEGKSKRVKPSSDKRVWRLLTLTFNLLRTKSFY